MDRTSSRSTKAASKSQRAHRSAHTGGLAHELIAWKPTVPLEQMAPGLRFILSGFDHVPRPSSAKQASGRLHYKRYIKGGIDFLVADAKMGVSKYATCVEKQIPILSEAEFKAALKAMQP